MFLLLIKFPDIVEFSEEMASLGKIVIVAALDGTFQRQVVITLLDWWLHVFRCSVYTLNHPVVQRFGLLAVQKLEP